MQYKYRKDNLVSLVDQYSSKCEHGQKFDAFTKKIYYRMQEHSITLAISTL